MLSYHVNPLTGNVNSCTAQEGNCPFGSAGEHYLSRQAGREAYEKTQEVSFAQRLTKASDAYSQRVPALLASMIAQAPDAVAKTIYEEALVHQRGQGRHLLHRFGEIYRQKSEQALKREQPQEAKAYYTLYRLASTLAGYREKMTSLEADFIREAYYAKHKEAAKAKTHHPVPTETHTQRKEELRRHYEAILKTIEGSGEEPNSTELWRDTAGLSEFTVREVSPESENFHMLLESADEIYPGKVSQQQATQTLHSITSAGEELAEALASGDELSALGSFDFEEVEQGPLPGAPAFELIAGGTENNVYLHRPTMMVYKVRHARGLQHKRESSTAEARRIAVVKLAELYQQVDKEALNAISASYLKTYFIAPRTGQGEEVPMIAQPFLDPSRYGAYTPSEDEDTYFRDLGLDDAHAANISVDTTTGRIVLFDCIHVNLRSPI